MKHFALLVFVGAVPLLGLAGEDNQAVLGVLAEGYTRNREAFPVIDCRFEVVTGHAATIPDALAGRLVGQSKVRRGHWLVDGSNVRYELLCDPALIEETKRIIREAPPSPNKEEGNVEVPCSDELYLRSESYSLQYGPLLLGANLFARGDSDHEGIRITPFNLDFMGSNEYSNPARFLRDALAGRFEAEFGGTERINGSDALVVTVVSKRFRNKFGFDPTRNYLLVYASVRDLGSGQRYFEWYVRDARQCSGNRWFPTRAVSISAPDSPKRPFWVDVLTVTDLDVDTKIPKERFHLDLAQGTQVSRMDHVEFTNLDQAETVYVDDLPALHQRCIAVGKAYLERRGMAKATHDRLAWPLRLLFGLIPLCAVAAVVWFYLLKRRRA